MVVVCMYNAVYPWDRMRHWNDIIVAHTITSMTHIVWHTVSVELYYVVCDGIVCGSLWGVWQYALLSVRGKMVCVLLCVWVMFLCVTLWLYLQCCVSVELCHQQYVHLCNAVYHRMCVIVIVIVCLGYVVCIVGPMCVSVSLWLHVIVVVCSTVVMLVGVVCVHGTVYVNELRDCAIFVCHCYCVIDVIVSVTVLMCISGWYCLWDREGVTDCCIKEMLFVTVTMCATDIGVGVILCVYGTVYISSRLFVSVQCWVSVW